MRKSLKPSKTLCPLKSSAYFQLKKQFDCSAETGLSDMFSLSRCCGCAEMKYRAELRTRTSDTVVCKANSWS